MKLVFFFVFRSFNSFKTPFTHKIKKHETNGKKEKSKNVVFFRYRAEKIEKDLLKRNMCGVIVLSFS